MAGEKSVAWRQVEMGDSGAERRMESGREAAQRQARPPTRSLSGRDPSRESVRTRLPLVLEASRRKVMEEATRWVAAARLAKLAPMMMAPGWVLTVEGEEERAQGEKGEDTWGLGGVKEDEHKTSESGTVYHRIDSTPTGHPPFSPSVEIYEYLKISCNPDGSITRHASIPFSPARAISKDLLLDPTHNTWIRIFIPNQSSPSIDKKLLVIIFFHNSGFILLNAGTTIFHDFCIKLFADALL